MDLAFMEVLEHQFDQTILTEEWPLEPDRQLAMEEFQPLAVGRKA
jgi:hypothetical protein